MEQQIKEFESLIDLTEELERQNIESVQKKRIIEKFLIDRAVVKHIPYTGSFELTPVCNLDCKMCYVHLNKAQMTREPLTTEQWIEILHQAVELGMSNAEITGGECLTHPGFKEIYRYLESQGVRISVLTNGVLLTEEMVGFFVRHRPRMVQITLYGSSEDVYESVTGYRVFRQVIDGINRLREAKIRLRISVTPNKYNAEDVLKQVELLRSMGLDYAVSGTTLNAREETGRHLTEYEIDETLLVRVIQNEQRYRTELLACMPMPEGKEFKGRTKGIRVAGVPCSAGKCTFHINWKGEMTPCIPFASIAFSVIENGVSEAWKKVNKKMWEYCEPKECIECENRSICMMCPADRTKGIYGGRVDKSACQRLSAYIAAGIIKRS